jgi:hypothetical protein
MRFGGAVEGMMENGVFVRLSQAGFSVLFSEAKHALRNRFLVAAMGHDQIDAWGRFRVVIYIALWEYCIQEGFLVSQVGSGDWFRDTSLGVSFRTQGAVLRRL